MRMDKKRSVLNVSVSIIFKIILLISSLIARRYLIRCLGNDVNGINSLYLSIMGVLSVAELGIGEAIIFCMYKPIVENDTDKVAALYRLFQKIYPLIGMGIAVIGCGVLPFVPQLMKGYASSEINVYGTFALMLLSVVLTYLFGAKSALIKAYKDNYITTTIVSSGQLLQHVLQIIVLCTTKSFVWYLACRVLAVGMQWILTEIVTRRKYLPALSGKNSKIDDDTKGEIVRNIKAMFMHRIGGVLVSTVDSILISGFIGIVILGKYSNYTTIMSAMFGTIVLFFTPLTSVIGHLFVQDKSEFKRYYNFFYALNFILGCVFFLGYYGVIDNLIAVLFGAGLELNKPVLFAITVNYFLQFMRQSTLLFRDASGTFYNDRWKPLAEGITNLVLSIVLMLVFKTYVGEEFAVLGVIVATIITNLLICHIVEPYVLHKNAFHASVKKYYLKNYCCIVVFIALLFVLDFCMVTVEREGIELLLNGGIAVGLSLIPITAVLLGDKDFRYFMRNILRKDKG